MYISIDITKEMISRAEQCLVENGIVKDEAYTVLQALGYILLDAELYPDDKNSEVCGYPVYHKHISEVNEGDRLLYEGEVHTASTSAFLTKTDIGKEWNVEVDGDDYLYASYFDCGIVTVIQEEEGDPLEKAH